MMICEGTKALPIINGSNDVMMEAIGILPFANSYDMNRIVSLPGTRKQLWQAGEESCTILSAASYWPGCSIISQYTPSIFSIDLYHKTGLAG